MVARTLFNEKHLQLKAKMMDFGGWDMPIHYGSQISEHLQTRESVTLFDVSHMAVVDITGADSAAFLQTLLANNIDKLSADGQAIYSCMLNDQAGILDDLIVYKIGPHYRLVINASTAIADLEWMYLIAKNFAHLAIVPRRSDLAGMMNPIVLLAVQGPHSALTLAKLFPTFAKEIQAIPYFQSKILATEDGEIMFSRTGYTGEDGFELFLPYAVGPMVWDKLIQHGVLPAGLGARDTLRIEAGYNLYGQDMNAQVTPFDCGLAWTVDLNHQRQFIGSEALRKLTKKYAFVGLSLLGKGIFRAHQVVKTPLGDGEVTSGTFSPSLQTSIAFARVPIGVEPLSEVSVVIRDQLVAAKVGKTAFVRLGKSLI